MIKSHLNIVEIVNIIIGVMFIIMGIVYLHYSNYQLATISFIVGYGTLILTK